MLGVMCRWKDEGEQGEEEEAAEPRFDPDPVSDRESLEINP